MKCSRSSPREAAKGRLSLSRLSLQGSKSPRTRNPWQASPGSLLGQRRQTWALPRDNGFHGEMRRSVCQLVTQIRVSSGLDSSTKARRVNADPSTEKQQRRKQNKDQGHGLLGVLRKPSGS